MGGGEVLAARELEGRSRARSGDRAAVGARLVARASGRWPAAAAGGAPGGRREGIRDCGRFAHAVDVLTDSIGVEARAAILGKDVPFSRVEIWTIADLPHSERARVWDAAVKDRSSLGRILAGEKRREARKDRADAIKLPGDSKSSAMERYTSPTWCA
jgi:hypothetical protein